MAYGVLGIWAFTNLEMAYALLRVEERRRTYLIAQRRNVVLTVALTVTLVVVLRRGRARLRARQLRGVGGRARRAVGASRCASTSASTGARRARSARCCASAAPTVPADAAVFLLNVVDRAYLLRAESAGRRRPLLRRGQARDRSSSSPCAASSSRGRRWPTRSPTTTRRARLYARVTTRVPRRHRARGRRVRRCSGAGSCGCSTAPAFYPAHEALPWLALGWALYGLYLVLRHHRRAREGHDPHAARPRSSGWRSTSSCLALLVGAARHRGRGRSRCAPPTWRCSSCCPPAHAAAVHGAVRVAAPGAGSCSSSGGISVAGELLLPTSGVAGFALRALALRGRPAWRSRPSCCACAASSSQARLNRLRGFGWRGPTGGRTARGAGVVVREGIAPPTPRRAP